MFNPKVFVAEFIGTFALVFVGAAAGIYGQSVGLLGIALAHGLTLVAFIYAFGHISGAHINPAVTLGLAANGNVKWSEAVVYWVAQLSGASVAAYLLKTLVDLIDPNVFASMATNGLLTTQFPYYAIGLEALLTFFLVNVVLQMAVEGKAGQFAGWAIGMTYAVAILAGGPLTGASLNPARSFGPAIFTSAIEAGRPDVQNSMFYLVYFVGPFAGAILAVLLNSFFKYEFVLSDEELDEMDESEEEPVVKPVKKTTRKPAARKSTARKTTKK